MHLRVSPRFLAAGFAVPFARNIESQFRSVFPPSPKMRKDIGEADNNKD